MQKAFVETHANRWQPIGMGMNPRCADIQSIDMFLFRMLVENRAGSKLLAFDTRQSQNENPNLTQQSLLRGFISTNQIQELCPSAIVLLWRAICGEGSGLDS